LLEVLFAVVIIGLAVFSLLAANIAYTQVNGEGANLSTAEFLVEQIRELTAALPVVDPETQADVFGPEEAALAAYDDVDDFHNATFSPPINADRNALSDFSQFNQHVIVERVDSANFEQVVTDHEGFVRITVTVSINSRQITSSSWIRAVY
jgi:hypothetical protein